MKKKMYKRIVGIRKLWKIDIFVRKYRHRISRDHSRITEQREIQFGSIQLKKKKVCKEQRKANSTHQQL